MPDIEVVIGGHDIRQILADLRRLRDESPRLTEEDFHTLSQKVEKAFKSASEEARRLRDQMPRGRQHQLVGNGFRSEIGPVVLHLALTAT